MEIDTTNRGFIVITLEDRNGRSYTVQESSLADTNAIWLGTNERIHLDIDQAAELAKILNHFVEQGDLRGLKTAT